MSKRNTANATPTKGRAWQARVPPASALMHCPMCVLRYLAQYNTLSISIPRQLSKMLAIRERIYCIIGVDECKAGWDEWDSRIDQSDTPP